VGADDKYRKTDVKQWLERIAPNRAQVREHKQLRVFGKRLQDPSLFGSGDFWVVLNV